MLRIGDVHVRMHGHLTALAERGQLLKDISPYVRQQSTPHCCHAHVPTCRCTYPPDAHSQGQCVHVQECGLSHQLRAALGERVPCRRIV